LRGVSRLIGPNMRRHAFSRIMDSEVIVMTPRAERSGREPTEARSALGVRAIYAAVAIVIGLAAGIWLWSIRPDSGSGRTAFAVGAVLCFLVALASAIDLVLLLLRRRRTG
jgi:hypothetical protein